MVSGLSLDLFPTYGVIYKNMQPEHRHQSGPYSGTRFIARSTPPRGRRPSPTILISITSNYVDTIIITYIVHHTNTTISSWSWLSSILSHPRSYSILHVVSSQIKSGKPKSDLHNHSPRASRYRNPSACQQTSQQPSTRQYTMARAELSILLLSAEPATSSGPPRRFYSLRGSLTRSCQSPGYR